MWPLLVITFIIKAKFLYHMKVLGVCSQYCRVSRHHLLPILTSCTWACSVLESCLNLCPVVDVAEASCSLSRPCRWGQRQKKAKRRDSHE